MRQLKITKSITNRESASLDKYLQEIGREDLITVEEEVELAQRIRKGDRVALEKLTRANLRFVVSVAKQYQNQGLSLPDLINEGNLGLIKAAEKFDETRGFKFISYAVWWIRQSILQALAEQSRIVRLPLNQVGSLNKISKAFSKFEQENERRPSPEELADELEIPVDKISDTLKVSGRHISVDAPFVEGEDNSLLDVLVNDDSPMADRSLVNESLAREIDRALSTLTEREKDIIQMFFGINTQEMTLEEIGDKFGRYYAMDRDNRWDRVELAYKALTKGEGVEGTDAAEAVQASYDAEKTDEFVLPTVLKKDGKPVATIQDKDSVIFFNFRPDRARELTRAFCADEFTGFEREKRLDLTYVCFTEYDETIPNKSVAFKKEEITNTFGEYLAAHNMTQARIAETEKYAHVTFFFNGGVEEPNKGEDRILVKSPKVATYDLKPEMSAYEVCDKLTDAIRSQKYDVIIINFANPDMVGHTGVESAAIQAVEAVDECVGKAVDALKEVDGQMFICADHGNAEQLVDYETGEPYTAHTTNPVPFILVNADPSYTLREGGCLADIAPTLIELMGMEQPKEMTGKSLLIKK